MGLSIDPELAWYHYRFLMNRVYIKTFGCQMNERDSEDVAAKLKARGYELVYCEESADIVLLNTCSVREQAEVKAIGKAGILQFSRKKDKNFILGIMGCMAQNRGSQLLDSLPDLDLVVGTQKFHRIPDILDDIRKRKYQNRVPQIHLEEEKNSQSEIKHHVTNAKNKVSAFVSIMQGCNMNCSFCIVPKTRGRERYRSMDDIVTEVQELSKNGIKEVTLLGQIVNAFGRGKLPKVDGKSPFVQLLDKIHCLDGIERIRFTSPHPISFGNDLIEAFGRLEKLGSYAHLPMQSGSNRILKSMNRPYTRERFIKLVDQLRKTNKNMRISTDVIVGYPSEGSKDFELTKDAFIRCGFEMAFIFKYSERSGTPAAVLNDKVPQEVKESRNKELLELLEGQSLVSNQKILGKSLEVLIEGHARKGEGKLFGRTPCYRKVVFPANPSLIGQIKMVEITDVTPNTLFGSLN